MKIRNGFVSNSSSSSFIISKKGMTKAQLNILLNHVDYLACHRSLFKKLAGYSYSPRGRRDTNQCNEWKIDLVGSDYHCSTGMDNIPLDKLMISTGVDEKEIKDFKRNT